MSEFLAYLLKVSAGIALVTLPYYLALRTDPSLLIKRVYLTGGILLSWIFPLISVRKPELVQAVNPVFLIEPQTTPVADIAAVPASPSGYLPIDITGMLYILGIFVFILLNVISLFRIRKNTIAKHRQPDTYITGSDKVFTIFPRIFLPKKYADQGETESILIHERAHIRQLHFVDLLISEITLALTWFNPFSWLISRMIKENHEHLADREVLSKGVKPAHYKALLLNHAIGGEIFRLGHQFNHSLTKKRFIMMKKMKATRKGSMKYLLFVPAILFFTLMATASVQDSKPLKGQVFLESAGQPAIGASIIVKGTTMGTVADMQGEFTLELTGNPELVFSFIGYETVTRRANEIKDHPVILIPTAYRIDFEETLKFQGLADVRIREADGVTDWKVQGGALDIDPGKDIAFLVDGIEVSNLDHLDPEDIEQIEVIKTMDDPEYMKYKDKDGVIIIRTRNGGELKLYTGKDKPASPDNLEKGKEEELFFVVEDVPSFPGGKRALGKYIHEHLQYPPDALKKQVAGKVLVEMTVNHDGSLTGIRINQSSNDVFNQAAMDVFSDMPEWNPGKQRGKPVKCKIIVPVKFNPSQE